jgi:hypothetical protein
VEDLRKGTCTYAGRSMPLFGDGTSVGRVSSGVDVGIVDGRQLERSRLQVLLIAIQEIQQRAFIRQTSPSSATN